MAQIECPLCGKLNNDVNDWCIGCKSDLKQEIIINLPFTECLSCGKFNIGSFPYCAFCGNHLSNMKHSDYPEKIINIDGDSGNLTPAKAIFYANENNLLNRSLYLSKIEKLLAHMRHYKDLLFFNQKSRVVTEERKIGGNSRSWQQMKQEVKNNLEALEKEDELVDLESVEPQEPAQAYESEAKSGDQSSFVPKENKIVCAAFAKIEEGVFFNNQILLQLKPEILKRIDLRESEKGKPEKTVYEVISDTIADELMQGEGWYVFKGVLNPKGRELTQLWNSVVKEQLKNGFYTYDEYSKEMNRISDTIQNNG